MAAQGQLIYASDYNVVQSVVQNVMGTGSGTQGYGQTVTSSQIVGNPNISTTQWANLRNDLLKSYYHLNSPGSLTIPTAPTTSTKITYADYAKYLAISTAVNSHKLDSPPSGQASNVTFSTGTRTTNWNSIIYHTVVMSFASQNAARFYFNAGGYITFQASLVGYPGYNGIGSQDASYTKNQDWNMLLNNMGTTTFNYGSTTNNGNGTGQTIASTTGYYQLTTSPTLIYSKTTQTTAYTPNQYDIYASVDATGAILTFSIRFEDLATSSGHNPTYAIDEDVEGTLTSLVKGYYASGSNVQVTAPSINNANPTIA